MARFKRHGRIIGVVVLVWFVGTIMGGVAVYYTSSYLADRQSREIRHDHNALICVLRSLVIPGRARSIQSALDKTQSDSVRARARNAVKTDDIILASLLTIPRNFDCATLSTKKT